MAETSPEGYRLHDSYWTQPALLGPDDADDLHSLSVAVNWPHRPQDLEMLLQFGQGCIARDQIGRAIGAGMSFAYGDVGATIGMMITHPKLQAGGLGQLMLSAILDSLETHGLRLNSTAEAFRLYRSNGFTETGRVVQHQGLAQAPLQTNAKGLRPATPEDQGAIKALDLLVFGIDRSPVLDHLLQVSDVRVLDDNGQVSGFAMCRPFGRGHVIGPLVATSEANAITLAGSFISDHAGQFLRLDVDERHTHFCAFLKDVGMVVYNKVTPMTKGAGFGPENAPSYVYGLASQTLG